MTQAHAASEPELLSLRDLAARGFGQKSMIYAMVASGEFPQPIKIGSNSRWLASELRDFIAQRAADRDGAGK
jgi:predicted DNA-binding transcriptional regulator AlpA